jgi:hypothetical protein
MLVDTELLHSGANESHRAGGHAQDGVNRLSRAHQQVLTALGRKAHHAATEFTDMDERNAVKLRAVRCNSAT